MTTDARMKNYKIKAIKTGIITITFMLYIGFCRQFPSIYMEKSFFYNFSLHSKLNRNIFRFNFSLINWSFKNFLSLPFKKSTVKGMFFFRNLSN